MQRYNRVAMGLHWLIALAVVSNLALGWWMHEAMHDSALQALATQAFQWHKSIGLSVLLLSLLRLFWRLAHPPPPLPAGMAGWERLVARLTHIGFYGLMLGLPLSGWLYVSTQWRGDAPLSVPTLWFGWLEIPHLFGLNQLSDALRSTWSQRLLQSHEILAYSMVGLLLLHVAAALKHQFYQRDDLLKRMWPTSKRGAFTGVAVVLAIILLLATTNQLGSRQADAAAAQIQSSTSGWQVQPQHSHIEFSGEHASEPFRGQFGRWQVDLQLDPAQPEQSTLSARIYTASARNGNPLHEQTLPQGEWFNVAQHPYAHFESSQIQAMSDDRWAVYGQLSIKNHSQRVGPLLLSLTPQQAQLEADLQIDRGDFDLGMDSDPSGQWVARQIGIHIALQAHPP